MPEKAEETKKKECPFRAGMKECSLPDGADWRKCSNQKACEGKEQFEEISWMGC